MADKTDKVISDIKTTSKYVTLSPETMAKEHKGALKITPITLKGTDDITRVSIAVASAVIETIATAESFSIEPNKLNGIAAKIIEQHNNVIADLVKHFSNSILDFKSSPEYKKIQDTVSKIVSNILHDKKETNVSVELTDKQKENIQKNINKIITAVLENVRQSCHNALWSLKEFAKNKLTDNTITSKWELDDEAVEKHAEEQTEKEFSQLNIKEDDTSGLLKSVGTIIKNQLTYGVIKFQAESLSKSLRSLSKKVFAVTEFLHKSVLDPVKFNKFFETVKHPERINQIIARAKRAAKLAKGIDDSEDVSTEDTLEYIKKEYEKFQSAYGNSAGINDERLSRLSIFKAAMKAKSLNNFSEKINHTITSEKKLAMVYGAGKIVKTSGKILATIANLSLKIFNTALGISVKLVKSLIDDAMKMIGFITNNLLMLPLQQITSDSNIMFWMTFASMGIEILASSSFAPGTELRKKLDSFIDPIKKSITNKISSITEKISKKIKTWLGIDENDELSFNNVIDGLIKFTGRKAADNNNQGFWEYANDAFKIIKFIVEKAIKVIDFFNGVFNTISDFTRKVSDRYTKDYNTKKEEKTEELQNHPGYIREYSKMDYIFDFDKGLFPTLWHDIAEWYDKSIISGIVNATISATMYSIGLISLVGPILDWLWYTAQEYHEHVYGINFLMGVSPLVGYAELAASGLAAMFGAGIDKKSLSVIDTYKDLFSEDKEIDPITTASKKIQHKIDTDTALSNEQIEHLNLFKNNLFYEQTEANLFLSNISDIIKEMTNMESNEFVFTPELENALLDSMQILRNDFLGSNIFQITPAIRNITEITLNKIKTNIEFTKLKYTFNKYGQKEKIYPHQIYSRILDSFKMLQDINDVRIQYLAYIFKQINSSRFKWDDILEYTGEKPILTLMDLPGISANSIESELVDKLPSVEMYGAFPNSRALARLTNPDLPVKKDFFGNPMDGFVLPFVYYQTIKNLPPFEPIRPNQNYLMPDLRTESFSGLTDDEKQIYISEMLKEIYRNGPNQSEIPEQIDISINYTPTNNQSFFSSPDFTGFDLTLDMIQSYINTAQNNSTSGTEVLRNIQTAF